MANFGKNKSSAMLFGIVLLLMLVPAYSQACRAASYSSINQYFPCSTTSYATIPNSQLPSNFNGAKQATFGFWMKNVLNMACVTGWQMVFKACYDITNYWARWPAIYHRIGGGVQYFYFGANNGAYNNYSEVAVPIVTNNWYYIIITSDFTIPNYMFNYYIYDPSKALTQLTDGIVFTSNLLFRSPLQYTYWSSIFLLFASDQTNDLSDVYISFPSVIAGTALTSYTDMTMMAYSLFNVPSVTVDFFGTPVMRHIMEYDSDTDILDTSSTFSYSYNYGTVDGTAQTNLSILWTTPNMFQTIQLNSPTQTLVLSPNKNFSFIDSWGYLSFGVRIVFKMTSMTYSSSCQYHWLFRRVQSGTGTVLFGLGVKSDGTVVVNVGGSLGTTPNSGIVSVNTWTTLKVGCFTRGFTGKLLCLVLNSDGLSQARQEIWISYASDPYTSDSTSDKLLFGGSSCGSSSIYFFQTNFGFVPELMDQCQWGCSQTLPTSEYCTLLGHWSNTCPAASSIKVNTRIDCLTCPRECATCKITDFSKMSLVCATCPTGMSLNSQGFCACAYGKYFDIPSATCLSQTVVYAYLALIPGSQYQFNVTFSSAISNLQMIVNYIQAIIINGDYDGNPPTITFINTQFLQITFSPANPLQEGTTLWVSGLTNYNQLPYNPYFIQPETLSYVFGLVPAYKTTSVAIPPAPVIPPLTYGPRYPTCLMSLLNLLFGVMGSSAMVLIKVLSDLTMYKFINVGFPQNYLNFTVEYLGNGFLIPNPFQNVESNATLIPISTIGQFQPWLLSTIYLQNAGSVLTKEIICAGLIVISWIVYIFSSGTLKFKDHMRRVIYIFQWNVSLCFLFGDLPELMLYSIIQIQEGSNATSYEKMSIAALVIMWIIYGSFYSYTFYLLNFNKNKNKAVGIAKNNANANTKNNKSNDVAASASTKNNNDALHDDLRTQQSPSKIQKRQAPPPSRRDPDAPDTLTLPPGMKIIAEGIYQDTIIARNFVLILQLHNLFISLVISLIQVSGIVQALFYILLNSAMLVYLPIARPFKSRVLYVILGGNCGGHLILGVFAALLGSNDRYPTMSSTTLSAIGIMMIMVEVVMLGASFTIAGIAIVQALRNFVRMYRKKVSDTQVKELKNESKNGGDTSRSKLNENDEFIQKRKRPA